MGRGRRTKSDETKDRHELEEAVALAKLLREEMRGALADAPADPSFVYMLNLTQLQMRLELAQSQAVASPADGSTHSRIAMEWGKLGLQLLKGRAKGEYAKLLAKLQKREEKGGKLKALAGGKK